MIDISFFLFDKFPFSAEQIEDDDVVRWAGTLPRARKRGIANILNPWLID